ncbi:hypothetical protein D9758_002690 [Tetrapyrgos nigripes]|uniref:RNA helicase n=1 Tax=Tetrapyrgos nigripes TaxID=182062 RepID=A0A8H5LTE5_9AGAR|nr:hypothetical protein D9758_002690 [Tetrapyrgos nigripes]
MERFNAKARQSIAGSHKKNKHKRSKSEAVDANEEVYIPKTQEEKELDRKEKLKQQASNWTSKKKKRLEKYIEKKLKKEERVHIFEKLSQSQAQIPSSLHLQSSSTLGTGKAFTHQEKLDKLEDKEVKHALGKRKRGAEVYDIVDADSDEEDEFEQSLDFYGTSEPSDKKADAAATSVSVGSALQRNPDGSVPAPKFKQKSQGKKEKTSFPSWSRKAKSVKQAVQPESDSPFDSSDSAYDSSDEEEGEAEGNASILRKVHEEEEEEEERKKTEAEEDDDDENEDDDEDDEDNNDSDPEPSPPVKKRSLGFKEWAMKQVNIAKGYVPPPTSFEPVLSTPSTDAPLPSSPKKCKTSHQDGKPVEMRGPLGEDLHLPSTSFAAQLKPSRADPDPTNKDATTKPKFFTVTRTPEVEESRLLLPVVAEEQPIMEAILLNPVVIICGETGSGKTTQVPQFLYEAGFGSPGSGIAINLYNIDNPGMIGITQPRRVAAMSMASRVAHELSLNSSKVSYQIRYDATVSSTTSIKFMTDGVLLRELATDFLLTKYSVIIIDEAHERSLNTDILIGVLSRILKLREELWKEGKEDAKPLRLVIMSATLRVSDFASNTALFSAPPPVINVAARQHPVTVHFNRRTNPDYISEAIKKTCKIHSRLPPGGILVFLTGQNEILGVCRKLEARFGKKALEERKKRRKGAMLRVNEEKQEQSDQMKRVGAAQADIEAEEIELGDVDDTDVAFDVDADDVEEDPDALDSDEEEKLDEELGIDVDESEIPMHIVPLYSLLPSEKQMKVFQPPPPGSRLVVVSTNVAETSLTIPGIRYVVDCGRAKERRYDITNGIQAFQVSWISKASAAQRAGRAGRTGPGHCYRLYSSALYEHHFDQFSQPEILRMPIEGVVLQMKGMHIDAVVNFPFPTPPDRLTLQKAENVLMHLGALNKEGQVTDLGRTMSLFPLSPRFSRVLVSGQQHQCLPYVIAVVSALSVGDPFIHEEALLRSDDSDEDEDDNDEALAHLKSASVREKEALRIRRKAFYTSQRTHSSLGKFTSDVFRILSVVGAYEFEGGGLQFCAQHFVRPKAMEEIHKLRAQISNIVETNCRGVDAKFIPHLRPPNDLQLKVLRQLLAAAFIDQVAVRKDRTEKSSSGAQFAMSKGVPYRALGVNEDVFIHPSSVLADVSPPEYVVFNELIRTSKVWIKGVTAINPAWLSSLGKTSLCTFSKPFKNSAGVMMVTPHFGPDGWPLPPVKTAT